MKRLIVCLALFALVIATAAVSTLRIEKDARAMLDMLEQTAVLLEKDALPDAIRQAKKAEKVWEKRSLAMFLFLDHATFSELDVLLPVLDKLVTVDKSTAKEQVLRCEGILKDLIAHQRVTSGNIL